MEGPSLIILREEAQLFEGQKLEACISNVKAIVPEEFLGQKLTALRSWGKHFLFCFGERTMKVHFLMFGSYRINELKPDKIPKLSMTLGNGAIHLYTCSVQSLTVPVDSLYDWRVDLMSEHWSPTHVKTLMKSQEGEQLCDVLLDQSVFAGAGNIIKNEVLFRLRLHPQTTLQSIPARQRTRLVQEMRDYCFLFYEWKKVSALRKNWQVYRKRICPICETAIVLEKTGLLHRVSFFCPTCQPAI